MSDDNEEWGWGAFFNQAMCTCNHEPDDHGWVRCQVAGCDCEAMWEE